MRNVKLGVKTQTVDIPMVMVLYLKKIKLPPREWLEKKLEDEKKRYYSTHKNLNKKIQEYTKHLNDSLDSCLVNIEELENELKKIKE
jgi:hypothetical protein